MRKTIKISLMAVAMIALGSCNNKAKEAKTEPVVKEVEDILTKEGQAALTPTKIIDKLKKGNNRYMNNDLTKRNHSKQIRKATKGQYPEAIVLSCVDSRVPVEDVFDKGIGDLFVARVAGNFVNEDILGSMEYACKVAGSKLVVVMGHEHCGAVKSAVKDVKLGNITALLSKIRPAVTSVAETFKGEADVKNAGFVHEVCVKNVKNTIDQIRLKSPILKEMEDKNEIKIVGAVYDLDNGKVDWLQ